MASSSRQFTVGELVSRTGVAAGTIRYYLSVGILPPPVRVSSNRFLYDERHVEALRLARLLRERRGLSLEAIARLLPDLLPDVVGQPDGGVFRPEMWGEVIETKSRLITGPSVSQRLIEAGVFAFNDRGYAEVTVEDICQATSIAKGSFYRHFASKEELFFAAVKATEERVVDRLGELASDAAVRLAPRQAAAGALAPYASILLDLAGQAARRRPGHGEALRRVASAVDTAVATPGAFAHGFALSVQGLCDSPLEVQPLLEAIREAAN